MLVYQQIITKEDCDIYEQMNTLKYMHKFYEAADDYFLQFGITDPILAAQNIGCAYLEFNTKFMREVKAGETISIDLSLEEKSRKVVTFLMKMIRLPEKEVVSKAILKFVYFDLITRKSLLLTDTRLRDFVDLF